GRVVSGELHAGETVEAQVDPAWRREVRRHHSVTHLLQRALKEVVGDAVAQRGSAVFPSHTRFDFDSPQGALRRDQERAVQARVNELIRADYHRDVQTMPFDEAVARGAIYMKGEHYGDVVRVVSFGPSVELCGGTHVASTGEIGLFVLTGESAIAAGVRRVEGVVSEAADAWIARLRDAVEQTSAAMSVPADKLADSVTRLAHERRDLEKRVEVMQAKVAAANVDDLLAGAKSIDGIPYLAVRVDSSSSVRATADVIRSRFQKGVLAVVGGEDGKVSALVTVGEDAQARGVSAQRLLAAIMPLVGGKGGGSAAAAQGGGRNAAGIAAALEAVPAALKAALNG
ncbi:MAG TPA: DHHA1 domain-containing protein, partial [Candidatus Acidoferrales bacterium]|nr:DHHA1 domain-containing protein [Candidatus Acidoferrales bacterium]